MFHFRTFPPSAPLREYLYCYLVTDILDDGALFTSNEALPMGITTLCFADTTGGYANKTGNTAFVQAPDIAIIGQMTERGETIFYRPFRTVIALFKTTALFQLGGVPMNLIAGRGSSDVTAVFSSHEWRDCREQMFQHADPLKIIHVLDTFLWKKLTTRKHSVRSLDRLTEMIHHCKGNVSLDWLTCQANMSVKTLERHFAEKIGLMPKYFSRVIRFKHAFQLLENKGRSVDIMNVVELCGYTDHSHLIKEFKHFSGRTPTFYHHSDEVITPFFLESMAKN